MSSFDPHVSCLTVDLPSSRKLPRNIALLRRCLSMSAATTTPWKPHSNTYLMDKEGRFVFAVHLRRTPEAAAADLRRHV